MAKRDYYEILGVGKGAGDDELKKAFRQMVKKYHPDANPDDNEAEAKFKEVNEAYSVLSDAEKRKTYDQYGHAAFEGGGGGYGGFSDFGGFGFGADDILNSFFGGGGRSRRAGPQRGADVETSIQIEFTEAVFGTEKELSLLLNTRCDDCGGTGAQKGTHPESCTQCRGTGRERVQQQTMLGIMTTERACSRCGGSGRIIKSPCQTCNGSGNVRKNERILVKIPKGIDSGQSIRIAGRGEPGALGGENGDLLIGIFVKPHKRFTRKGTILFCRQDISITQAALGDDIEIETLYGAETLSVKAGTQPGATVTMRGKGVPNLRNDRVVGDLIVNLNVVVPTSLNDQQKELLREFAQSQGENLKDEKKGFFDKFKK